MIAFGLMPHFDPVSQVTGGFESKTVLKLFGANGVALVTKFISAEAWVGPTATVTGWTLVVSPVTTSWSAFASPVTGWTLVA